MEILEGVFLGMTVISLIVEVAYVVSGSVFVFFEVSVMRLLTFKLLPLLL
jgi:uncharacterized membrane protein